MAKNDKAGKVTEDKNTALAAPGANVHDLTKQAAENASLTASEKMRRLQASLGADEIEVIAAGKLPFWPALAGAEIVGVINARRDVVTRFKSERNPTGEIGVYTFTVSKPCLAGTLDGEIYQLDAGDSITVLERKVLEELKTRIGQKVAIHCVGKVLNKEGNEYWDYIVVGARRTAEQIQAASMQAMVAMQQKQLEAAKTANQ